MQANSFPFHTPSTTGIGSKVKTFFSESGHDAYQIKWYEADLFIQYL